MPPKQDEDGNPPPPPPPPPDDLYAKMSPFVSKLRSAPPGYFYQAPKQSPLVDLLSAPTGPYFFYGTLADPSMLAELLRSDEIPKLRPAYILGYECKLWGQYPALVDAPGSTVQGVAYHVHTVADGEKLAAYETGNYRTEPCLIKYTDEQEPAEDLGHTFKSAGNLNDISDGSFDLRVWLKRMGRHAAVDKLDAVIDGEGSRQTGDWVLGEAR